MSKKADRPDDWERLLESLGKAIPDYESAQADLRRAIEEGQVSEEELRTGFRSWWKSLSPTGAAPMLTLGSALSRWLEDHRRAPRHLAHELGCPDTIVGTLLMSQEAFDTAKVPVIALKIAHEYQLAYAAVQRVLNAVVVDLNLKAASGPSLKAARRPPDDSRSRS